MGQGFLTQLDEKQQQLFDNFIWYNVTGLDPVYVVYGSIVSQTFGQHWRGRGGDFYGVDYVFRKTSSAGVWDFTYLYRKLKAPLIGETPN